MTPEIKKMFGCPYCGFRVSGVESACPRCGHEFSQETTFECPFCGSPVNPAEESCPACEVQFHKMAAQVSDRLLDKAVAQIVDELDSLADLEKIGPHCPVCSGPLKAPGALCERCEGRRLAELEKKGKTVEEYLDAEIFGEEESALCPICKSAVSLHDLKCPSCGVEFEEEIPEQQPTQDTVTEEEEELAKCPQCGALSSVTASACPNCGAEFEEEGFLEEEVAPRPAPKKVVVKQKVAPKQVVKRRAPARPVPVEPRGLSNGVGIVNGRGRTNGIGRVNGRAYTNGASIVNGRGRVNGRVNGKDLINGTGALNGAGARVPSAGRGGGRYRHLLRWRFIALLVALVILFATFAYMSRMTESPPYDVDGNGEDWADAVTFGMAFSSISPSTNVAEWAVDVDDDDLYMYIKTEGATMASEEIESFYLFIDLDDSATTGYSILDIGADVMMELHGWNGSVMQSAVRSYHSQNDPLDWSGWTYASSAVSAVDGDELEAMTNIFFEIGHGSRFLLISKDQNMNGCSSYPVTLRGGLLVVDVAPSEDVASDGVLTISENAQLVSLSFSCEGEEGTIDSVSPEFVGITNSEVISQFSIGPGEKHTVELAVDSSTLTPGQFVSATIREEGITSSFSRVHLVKASVRAYAGTAPTTISIDGAFADWTGKTVADFDPMPIENPNIDINEVGAHNDSIDSFFYVDVCGDMCSGDFVPKESSKPSGTGGGAVVPARRTAEDFMRVYIDSDQSSDTGLNVVSGENALGADYQIEISGFCCEITSSALMRYQSGEWIQIGTVVDAAVDRSSMEIGVPSASIGASGSIDFLIISTDWRGTEDIATNDTTMFGVKYWVVSSSSTDGTSMSYQRKMFYDGTNFWSFHYDGTDTIYHYSSDGGQTWNSGGQVFSTSGVMDSSLWYDASTHQVYVVGDRAVSSTLIYIQKGSVNPDTHTVTWSGQQTLAVSNNNLAGKNTFISKDTNGYLWILSSQQAQANPVRYNLVAYKSSSVNDTSSWALSGTMLASGSDNSDLRGSILPSGTGSDVFAVYNYDSSVEARKCTSGSWGSAENIYTDTGSIGFMTTAPASAVVDGDGALHVVFGDANRDGGADKPHIQYRYRHPTTGWEAAITLDEDGDTVNHRYPTISLDTSTGNLYAFWITVNDNNVACKKNVGGSWSFVTLSGQTGDGKQHLTSVYSVPGESYVCWQWTQNSTANVEVNFDKIPEFGDVVIPITIIIAMFFVTSRRRRSSGPKQQHAAQ